MHSYILVVDIGIRSTSLALEYTLYHLDPQFFQVATDGQRLNIKIRQEILHQPSIPLTKSLARKLLFYPDIPNSLLEYLAFDVQQQGRENPLRISYLFHDA